MLATLVVALSLASAAGASTAHAAKTKAKPDPYRTTLDYVVRFYPLWISYNQAKVATTNRLIGPAQMDQTFGEVVAPNDDTLYVSSFLNTLKEPMVLTIPTTQATYSILSLDLYGNVFSTGIPTQTGGSYAFVSPRWHGKLPTGVQKVELPVHFTNLILRADTHARNGTNQVAIAESFRANLRLSPLSEFLQKGIDAGRPLVVPVSLYASRYKIMADEGATRSPTAFLKGMQQAVRSPWTDQSRSDNRLARRFNKVFRRARTNDQRATINRATGDAHSLINDTYLSHTGNTGWVTFKNIGNWGKAYAQRSAISEFIQWGNDFKTAAYFQAFSTKNGVPLDAGVSPGFELTIPKSQLPQASRFWSLTAYVPGSITLVENTAKKYVVASYTEGLHQNADDSITIYMQPEKPHSAPEANWLPVPAGAFNVMLRVYGPEGTVAAGKYTPPGIRALQERH